MLSAAVFPVSHAFLDERAKALLRMPKGLDVTWVAPRPASRLRAELQLARDTSDASTVLCFHGLPPLFPQRRRVVVFLQNRLYLGRGGLTGSPARVRVRVAFERSIAYALRRRVDVYVVQTPSMQRDLLVWHGGNPEVRICPFVGRNERSHPRAPAPKMQWDFVYVADGAEHKNHLRLFEAWVILAEAGRMPTLALTLGPRDRALIDKLESLRRAQGVRIHNLGHLPHESVLMIYETARALVFPSLMESFGLPLLEASERGLPILASELDFVRDICTPVQTFDPHSATSIARAIMRFEGAAEPPVAPETPERFFSEVLA